MEGGIIMREENYFKIKLRMSIDTLSMAKRKLEHLDIQMNLLKVRFDHDKKVYDDLAIHMQNIVKDMEKRIPELEKKIEKGFTTIDMRTGKGYKSFTDRHMSLLQDKIKETESREKALAEANKQKLALRKKKRDKLSDEELDIVIAEEVRESLQPADELEANREREKERLEEKAEYYREKLAELKAPKKPAPEVEFDTVGNEIKEIIKADPAPKIKEIVNEILEEADEKIIDESDLDTEEITTGIADLTNGETEELQWLTAKRPDWIKQFELEEGGKAVWQGRITNGFKVWCEAKGYKIGG